MKDRFRYRTWYTPAYPSDDERPHYIYDVEQLYDGYTENGASELGWISSFGELLDNREYILEQCTSLKDKNGKLIYEGDVLKITDQGIDDIVKVYWESGMYCFSISPNSANLVFSDLSDNETTCEIVGNIHENADLLGESNG